MNREQQTPPLPGRVYTVKETAMALRLGLVSVYKLLREGQLRRCKLGRRTLILVADVDALLERLASKASGAA